MTTRYASLLASVCCTLLLGASGPSQSNEISQRGVRALNLGLATTEVMRVDGRTAAFTVSEAGQRRDLNGDGDLGDRVVHVFDASFGEVRNLGLSTAQGLLLQDRVLAFGAQEASVDLNGDGDRSDSVLHVYDTVRRSLTNLRLESNGGFFTNGRRLAFAVNERSQGEQDLNQDGDTQDSVLHLLDLVTGRIQDTGLAVFISPKSVVLDGRWVAVAALEKGSSPSREVLHLIDTVTGRIKNLGLALGAGPFQGGFSAGDGAALVEVTEFMQGIDLNGDGDLSDRVLHKIDLASGRVENTGLTIATVLGPGLTSPIFDFVVQEGRAVFNIAEADQRKDLNGDGDVSDVLLHVLSTRTGRLRNLNVAATLQLSDSLPGRAVLFMSEADNGKDLNGDGDLGDDVFGPDGVLGLADFSDREPRVVNTRLAISQFPTNGDDLGLFFTEFDPFQLRGHLFSFVVSEIAQGNRDLNGDGDTSGNVLHIADLSTFTTRNTGLSGAFAYRAVQAPLLPSTDGDVVVPVRESRQGNRDLNRDGDADDMVLQLFDLRSGRSRNTGVAIAAEIGESISIFFPL